MCRALRCVSLHGAFPPLLGWVKYSGLQFRNHYSAVFWIHYASSPSDCATVVPSVPLVCLDVNYAWHPRLALLCATYRCHISYFTDLPQPTQWLLLFTIKNRKLFHVNQGLHSLGTRQQQNFYKLLVNLKKYQLGPYYMGLKLYNTLPTFLKTESHSFVSFISSLKKNLLEFSIYSLDEFYNICKLRKHKLQD